MTNYFVTRHPGAIEWFNTNVGESAEMVSHWTPQNTANLKPGDVVIGILPVGMVAEVCATGARFMELSLPNLPPELRGKELSAEQMVQCGACLKEFVVTTPSAPSAPSGGHKKDKKKKTARKVLKKWVRECSKMGYSFEKFGEEHGISRWEAQALIELAMSIDE